MNVIRREGVFPLHFASFLTYTHKGELNQNNFRSIQKVLCDARMKGARMAKIDTLVEDFLAQKKIAVVGVSDQRETGCNLAYRKFKEAGYEVSAVNPRIESFEGDPCYPDLGSVPEKPEAVFILTNPKITDQIVEQCVDLGIQHVWMHCLMGTKPGLAASMTSVSEEAVRMCEENGIAVIPGTCPNQFLKPDFGHKIMRGMFRTFGFLRVN
jgi:predicted CoA-binding protein